MTRISGMEFPEGTCQEAADEGYEAGAAGKPSSANPYKHPALRQAWEDNRRQYHEDKD
jgi:ribosome modulation factor